MRDTSDYVVIDKPAGIPVHPTCDNAVENVAIQIGSLLGVKLGTMQRLDIATQGLMVLAKTREFQIRFSRWLETRKVVKKYRALIPRPLTPREVIHYMQPGERAPRVVGAEPREGWKLCALRIDEVVAAGGPQTFEARVTLLTGRNHQVRTQLSALGAPILGDELYGSKLPAPLGLGTGEAIALQSFSLRFPGDGGGEASFSLPAPW